MCCLILLFLLPEARDFTGVCWDQSSVEFPAGAKPQSFEALILKESSRSIFMYFTLSCQNTSGCSLKVWMDFGDKLRHLPVQPPHREGTAAAWAHLGPTAAHQLLTGTRSLFSLGTEEDTGNRAGECCRRFLELSLWFSWLLVQQLVAESVWREGEGSNLCLKDN